MHSTSLSASHLLHLTYSSLHFFVYLIRSSCFVFDAIEKISMGIIFLFAVRWCNAHAHAHKSCRDARERITAHIRLYARKSIYCVNAARYDWRFVSRIHTTTKWKRRRRKSKTEKETFAFSLQTPFVCVRAYFLKIYGFSVLLPLIFCSFFIEFTLCCFRSRMV